MSFEITEGTRPWSCGARKIIEPKREFDDRFVRKYFKHQLDFSEEELGDQIDGSDAAICSAAGVEALGYGSHLPDNARIIESCITNRFMGICASNGCIDRYAVTQFIETL